MAEKEIERSRLGRMWEGCWLQQWWSSRSLAGKIGWPFLGLIVAGLLMSDFPAPQRAGVSIDRANSVISCEEAVKERLKAPSAAEFRGTRYQAPGSHTRIVTGNVDAENSFGAKLRSSYRCELERRGDSWYIEDMTIE